MDKIAYLRCCHLVERRFICDDPQSTVKSAPTCLARVGWDSSPRSGRSLPALHSHEIICNVCGSGLSSQHGPAKIHRRRSQPAGTNSEAQPNRRKKMRECTVKHRVPQTAKIHIPPYRANLLSNNPAGQGRQRGRLIVLVRLLVSSCQASWPGLPNQCHLCFCCCQLWCIAENDE